MKIKRRKKVINANKKFKKQNLIQVVRNPKREGKIFSEKKYIKFYFHKNKNQLITS